MKFRKDDDITNGKVLYRVLTAHRDGTYTVRALWGLDDAGDVCQDGGYLGYVYHRQDLDATYRTR